MPQIIQHSAYTAMAYATLSSDHATPATGKTLTLTLSKAGGAFASITPTVTDRGSGWYSIALTSSHTDTLGELAISGTAIVTDDLAVKFQVLAKPDVVGSSVNDAGATTSTFVTALTETGTDHWRDSFLRFTGGTLSGQVRRVTAYNGSTKAVTCDAFSAAPANGDKFVVVNV